MRVTNSCGGRRRVRGVVALALVLAVIAATVPVLPATVCAQLPGACPPDSAFIDYIQGQGHDGPLQVQVDAQTRSGYYILDGFARGAVEWTIDVPPRRAYFRVSSMGSIVSGGHQMSAARFDLAATSAGGTGTAMVVARLDLATHVTNHFWKGMYYGPSGEIVGRLVTPAGVVEWHPQAIATGDLTYRLESEPFEVSVGAPFDIRWETGCHHVSGYIAITGELTLGTFGDPGVQIRDCAGETVALTPVQPTTWGGIKALFR